MKGILVNIWYNVIFIFSPCKYTALGVGQNAVDDCTDGPKLACTVTDN